MTKQWNKEAHDHVFRALRAMLAKEPFYAHLAFNLPWVQKEMKNDVISTDGLSIIYDPEKVMALMKNGSDFGLEFTAFFAKDNSPSNFYAKASDIMRALQGATLTRVALRHP